MENNKLNSYMERANIIVDYYETNPERLTQKNLDYLVRLRHECSLVVADSLPEKNIRFTNYENYEIFHKLNDILNTK